MILKHCNEMGSFSCYINTIFHSSDVTEVKEKDPATACIHEN